MFKKMFLIFTITIFMFSFSSCSYNGKTEKNNIFDTKKTEQSPIDGGLLNLCIFSVDSLNPLNTQNKENLDVLSLMFDSLFELSQDFSTKNSLCESYTISEDGLSYSFKIRDNVTFHNGKKLTAEDVNASFKHILESGSPKSLDFALVEETAASGLTWRLRLIEPVSNFIALLDFPIIPKEDANSQTLIENTNYIPVGTGIYKVENYKISKELDLVPNKEHFLGSQPFISNIKIYLAADKQTVISMFENYTIDILPKSIAKDCEHSLKRNCKAVSYPSNKFTFIGINNQKPLLISSSVRKAIASCIDKNSIYTLSQGKTIKLSELPFHPQNAVAPKDLPATTFDTHHARSLLTDDGFSDVDGDNLFEKIIYDELHNLSLNILVNSESQERQKLAENIKSNMEKAGFSVSVTSVDFATYTKKIESGNYDLFIGSIDFSVNNDLGFFLATGNNMFGFSNSRLDLCLSQLKAMTNASATENIYKEICDIILSEAPIVGLYYDDDILYCDEKISGDILPTPTNVLSNIEKWYIS